MTNLRGRMAAMLLGSVLALSACGKTEPDLPTFDPLDKIRKSEGWKVGRAIAVSPGAKSPNAHHVQAIASGLHDIDFETPPTALTPVQPSCSVPNPGMGGGKYLIMTAGGIMTGQGAEFPLMKNPAIPGLMAFNDETASAFAKEQAESMIKKGKRTASRKWDWDRPSSKMLMRDIFITNTSENLVLALAGGELYNFHFAPGVNLSSVVVYSETNEAAVMGVPDHIPVSFVSKTHKATKRCWTPIQARPDESWGRASSQSRDKKSRYNLSKPRWRNFRNRVKRDIGTIPEDNVISVAFSGHFLIGPAPTRYEDRIPYVAFGGKSIRYMAADHVRFGSRDDNGDYIKAIVDQYYEAHLAAASK